jgi:DNA polymerase-3 subunit delta'
MLAEEPLGHAPTIRNLWSAQRRERLPHALLFEGSEGIGKYQAAKWFACGMLCEEGPGEPCGECGPCKRVRSGSHRGNHPDLFVIDPQEQEQEHIRISRIAYRPEAPDVEDPEDCVESFLGLRALESQGRAVLIRDAHRMNAAAQNALLKTLEEPRPGVVLVLVTHRSDALLPTIHSRCTRLRFCALELEDCRRILARSGIEAELQARLARWAEGSPGRALALHARGVREMRARLRAVLTARESPHPAAAALHELEGAFSGDKPTARARDRATTFLSLVLAVLRDARRLEAGLASEELAHGELLEELREARALPQGAALAANLELCLECLADVERNVAPEALLERALLALAPG